jgi:hypothetical protein
VADVSAKAAGDASMVDRRVAAIILNSFIVLLP